jgi:hypothetical protein
MTSTAGVEEGTDRLFDGVQILPCKVTFYEPAIVGISCAVHAEYTNRYTNPPETAVNNEKYTQGELVYLRGISKREEAS